MKFFIHKGSTKVTFGTTVGDDKPRADMYMPASFLILGFNLVIWGLLGMVIYFVLQPSAFFFVLELCCLLFGVGVLLCWKNMTIRVLSEEAFVYTTSLGRKKLYRFSEIIELRRSSCFAMLFVAGGKIYIDYGAITTKRLKDHINQQLKENGCKEVLY